MMRTALLLAAAVSALGGCSDNASDEADPAAMPGVVAVGNRQTLTREDVEAARLTGELSCAFVEPGADGPLLVASADVLDAARAESVLRLGPSTLRLRADATGGFNALVRGARFTSGDLVARVVVTSETPLAQGESPPLPARLEISTPSGSQRIEGEWTCGP